METLRRNETFRNEGNTKNTNYSVCVCERERERENDRMRISTWWIAHNFALNNWKARSLFLSWVLSSVQKMRIPVGLWTRSTAVSTLLTFWPAWWSHKRNDLMRIFHSFFFLQKMKHGKANHYMNIYFFNFADSYLLHPQTSLLLVQYLLGRSPPQRHPPKSRISISSKDI